MGARVRVSRVALVTGGGRGIGRAVVEALAAGGHRVIAVGRDRDALEEAATDAEGDVSAEICDVTEEREVRELAARAGRVDVLVNNAGVSTSAPLHRTSLADWQRQLDVNATGAFLLTRELVGGMRERGWGRVITVASTAGLAGVPYTAGYTASKHAAVGLMRAAAAELAGTGVTANAICPGFVRTDMTERSVARIVDRTGRTHEQAERALAESSPLGRLLEPDEVAAAIAYLASEAAAAVNGQTLVIDGGGVQT
jgi:NAD(P)-dependent dehydrogenase (short-subunit alcohol dehydrogenase family)